MKGGYYMMYNIRQASVELGVKVRTIREWIRSGKIKAVKYNGGTKWYISEEEISRIKSGKK